MKRSTHNHIVLMFAIVKMLANWHCCPYSTHTHTHTWNMHHTSTTATLIGTDGLNRILARKKGRSRNCSVCFVSIWSSWIDWYTGTNTSRHHKQTHQNVHLKWVWRYQKQSSWFMLVEFTMTIFLFTTFSLIASIDFFPKKTNKKRKENHSSFFC